MSERNSEETLRMIPAESHTADTALAEPGAPQNEMLADADTRPRSKIYPVMVRTPEITSLNESVAKELHPMLEAFDLRWWNLLLVEISRDGTGTDRELIMSVIVPMKQMDSVKAAIPKTIHGLTIEVGGGTAWGALDPDNQG